jgi:hypothetical protein
MVQLGELSPVLIEYAGFLTELSGELSDRSFDVLRLEVLQMWSHPVAPGFKVFADSAAEGVTLTLAVGFHEVDAASQAVGGEPAEIAHQLPADGVVARLALHQVFLDLDRVVPGDFHVKSAGILIDTELVEVTAGDALQGTDSQSGANPLLDAGEFETSLQSGGVGLPPEESESGKQTAGVVVAEHADNIEAKLAEGVYGVEHQAASSQIDITLFEREEV